MINNLFAVTHAQQGPAISKYFNNPVQLFSKVIRGYRYYPWKLVSKLHVPQGTVRLSIRVCTCSDQCNLKNLPN
jgi:hypothetical protein